MKLFLIKSIIIFFGLFVLFKITIDSAINNLQEEVKNQISNEKIILTKDKIRKEMKKKLL